MKYFIATIFLLSILALFPKSTLAAEAPGLTLKINDSVFSISSVELASWRGNFTLSAKPLFVRKTHTTQPVTSTYDPEKIYRWVKTISTQVDTPPQEGSLTISGQIAQNFTPPVVGVTLDAFNTTHTILAALSENQNTVTATSYEIRPETNLSSSNSLGINELIGHGESNFAGSPKNRRHNISVGVEKLKGIIVGPGEEFSFNKNICPVEKTTGYLPELVIKADGTKPEYGGGLCQVSSTVFRAAMDAGLKIIQRKNHSYAVQYYAPQGTDATTYCGGVDFRFLNDTSGSILIWPHFKGDNGLVFDFYGTKDDRQITLEKAVQYDRKSDGSMKATWIRHVTKDGITNTDTFKSVYLPPALFHKEEKLDAPGQTPTTTTPSPLTPPPPMAN